MQGLKARRRHGNLAGAFRDAVHPKLAVWVGTTHPGGCGCPALHRNLCAGHRTVLWIVNNALDSARAGGQTSHRQQGDEYFHNPPLVARPVAKTACLRARLGRSSLMIRAGEEIAISSFGLNRGRRLTYDREKSRWRGRGQTISGILKNGARWGEERTTRSS